MHSRTGSPARPRISQESDISADRRFAEPAKIPRMTDETGRVVGIVEIRITAPYVRSDGRHVSEGGLVEVRNLADQSEEDLLAYAHAALAERRGPPPIGPRELLDRIRRLESWPWEEVVFPLGTIVRPRNGGAVGEVVGHGVDGVFVQSDDDEIYGFWDPWELIPVRS